MGRDISGLVRNPASGDNKDSSYHKLPPEIRRLFHERSDTQTRANLQLVSKTDYYVSKDDLKLHKQKIENFKKTLFSPKNSSTPEQDYASIAQKDYEDFKKTSRHSKLTEEQDRAHRAKFTEKQYKSRHRIVYIFNEAILRNRPDIIRAARLTKNKINLQGPIGINATAAEALIQAAEKKDMRLLKEVFAHPALNETASNVLYRLGKEGKTKIIETFVEAGANVNVNTRFHGTPLHSAAFRHDLPVITKLLEAKADIEVTNVRGKTPLNEALSEYGPPASSAPIVKALIAQRANPNSQDYFGDTPLHRAAYKGDLESIKELIQAGAKAEVKDTWNSTPLELASGQGQSIPVRSPNFREVEIILKEAAQREAAEKEKTIHQNN